jgi:RNA polymerase sigma factor (sigma-70 family)
MEARTVPRAAPAGASGFVSPRLLRVASDAHLVALVREGRAAAFEAAYSRHHRAILSFCRHMLGSLEEAEDVVQHTFLAAYNDLISSNKQIHLRAWLFTIARNRCYSVLRSRREQPLGDLEETATEGLASQVQRRQDLRDLVGDLRRLPDDQRAALVLSEMDALSHEQIADVLAVPKDKVKALVFQARESLIASRTARETDCAEIREQLCNLRGGALRRANLRRHLRECTGCSEFRQQLDRQRRQLRVLLPVAPTLALKEAVLAATVGGSATVTATAGGGLVASSLLKGGLIKGMVGATLAGIGTAGTIVAVHDFQASGSGLAGGHTLSARAPAGLKPAATRTTASIEAPAPGTPTAGYASSYSSPATRLVAATGGGGSASARPRTSSAAASTMIAILQPLSPKGLTSTVIPSPLATAPAGLGSGGGTGSSASTPHSHTLPQPTSSIVPNAPYLAPSAFGTGGQSSTGGTRSKNSNAGSPTPSSAGTSASSTSSGWTGQTQAGSSPSGPSAHSVTYAGTGTGTGTSAGSGTHSSAPSSGSASSQSTSVKSSSGSGSPSGPTGGTRGGSSSSTSGSSSGSGASGSSGTSTGSGSSAGSGSSGSSGSSTGSGSGSSTGTGTGSSSGSGSGYGGGTSSGPHGR